MKREYDFSKGKRRALLPTKGKTRITTKKAKRDELRPEYRREDLGKGVRGKYAKAYRAGTNLVLLQPEVAAAFPTERAVNDALSSLIEVAEHAGLTRRSTGRTKTARR